MKKYRKRIADDILKRKLEGKGAILIEEPKWCGKTTTAAQQAKTIIYMDDPEEMAQNLTMADLTPKALLKGGTPILIDKWQIAPKLWMLCALRSTTGTVHAEIPNWLTGWCAGHRGGCAC